MCHGSIIIVFFNTIVMKYFELHNLASHHKILTIYSNVLMTHIQSNVLLMIVSRMWLGILDWGGGGHQKITWNKFYFIDLTIKILNMQCLNKYIWVREPSKEILQAIVNFITPSYSEENYMVDQKQPLFFPGELELSS